ncbi:MAG: MBL fold metallo-hydrolase [Rhodospirillales bacterium]
MARFPYAKGLHDLGTGCFGYLQPDGGWGLSNAGLIVDQGQSLLVDTLMDLPLTREMLAAMRKAAPAAERIGTLVNTHANPDHTFGNQLVEGAVILSSDACLEEMREQLKPNPRGNMRTEWQKFGDAGRFFNEVMFSRFSYDGVVLTLPQRTFTGELTLHVGAKEVRLLEVGPAHTRGDVIVYVPADKTLFAGDIMFVGGHPVVWAGPIANWIKACDVMLGWDVETVVPGHGPITDKSSIRDLRDYLKFVEREARARYDAGMGYEEAARDIDLRPYEDWIDRERIVLNVFNCYREFARETGPFDRFEVIGATGRYYYDRKAGKL